MTAQRYYLMTLILTDKPQEALDHFDTISEISPKDPEMMRIPTRQAEAYLCLNNYEKAREYGKTAIAQPIIAWPSYTVLISALGHLGDSTKADDAMEKMRARIVSSVEYDCLPEDIMNLSYVKEHMPFCGNQYEEIYLSGLKKTSFPA